MGTPVRGVMAVARLVGSVCGNRADLHGSGELAGQPGRIVHAVSGDFDGPDYQRLFVDADVNIAPDTAFGATMLAGVPLAVALRLDAGAVDKQMQRTFRSAVGDVYAKVFCPSAQSAGIRHHPVEADQAQQAQQAPHKACRLPEGHAEEDFHRQTGLDRSITILRLSASLSDRWAAPRPSPD